jgi:hypothetical protein
MSKTSLLGLLMALSPVATWLVAQTPEAASPSASVAVGFVSDEADAVLAILRERQTGRTPAAGDWAALFSSAGYRALERRETAMGRGFSKDGFRAFVLSDTLLLRAAALERTLAAWKEMDVRSAADRAFAYLPAGTPLRATVFLEIKPFRNSFVFDLDGARAIFLYVDPGETRGQIENTVAHELHHTGIAAACRGTDDSALAAPVRQAREWLTAFGEGLAMVAAAGGPDAYPHALDDSTTRARWDRDVANFNPDVVRVEAFLRDVLDGRLSPDSTRAVGMSFFGIQGPWYTVGWRMAVTVERTFGRDRLIRLTCHPVDLLVAYNAAVRAGNNPPHLALWSEDLLGRLGAARIRDGS